MTGRAPASDSLSPQFNFPYLTGVYLFVAAVKDLYHVVDGPLCVYEIADLFCRKHDLSQDVFSPSGESARILATGAFPRDGRQAASPEDP